MMRERVGAAVRHFHKLVEPRALNPDDQLLERFIASREEEAFAALVRRHGPLVLRVCQYVLRDAHAAEDAFQATFLVLARKASAVRSRASLYSWLYGVALRTARKARGRLDRRRDRERHLVAEPCVTPAAPQTELRAVLDDELLRLPSRFRAPLVLCYLQGKTYAEAARELGLSEGSMSRLLAQARERLRVGLVGRGFALSVTATIATLTAGATVPATLVAATTRNVLARSASSGSRLFGATVAEGVIRDMLFMKIKWICAIGLAFGALVVSTQLVPGPAQQAVACPEPSRSLASREEPVAPAETDMPEEEDPEDGMAETPPSEIVNQAFIPDKEFELPPAATIVIKRRDLSSEDELRAQLAKVPELKFEQDDKQTTGRRLAEEMMKRPPEGPIERSFKRLSERADLQGAPLMSGSSDNGQRQPNPRSIREVRGMVDIDFADAKREERIARFLRHNLRDDLPGGPFLRERERGELLSSMVQVLMGREAAVRRVLVEYLGQHEGEDATAALAKLAVFDLSPEVRADAVQALLHRPKESTRPILLRGLRYPWAPVVDHAAEALVALEDQGAVKSLKQLDAELSSTATPTKVGEVVRVNHLQNCQLCHSSVGVFHNALEKRAPGIDQSTAMVPTPGEPLPPSIEYYLQLGEGSILVQANVLFLRQDFSARYEVANADPWPTFQRYDYFIRTRPALTADLSKQREATAHQRQAIRFVLDELSRVRDTTQKAEEAPDVALRK